MTEHESDRSAFTLCVAVLLATAARADGAAFVCPLDCNVNGVVTQSELLDGRDDILEPLPSGAPDLCPAVDYDEDGSYGVEDLTRGANARATSCVNVVAPAGLRGSVINAATGEVLTGATVEVWAWPGGPGPTWAWPGTATPVPSPTPGHQTTSYSPGLVRGLPAPNFAFDAPSSACLTGVAPVSVPPTPGWRRFRVTKAGYETTVFYQYLGFGRQEKSFVNSGCITGASRPVDTGVFPIWAQSGGGPGPTPTPHDRLPDLIVDPRELDTGRRLECVAMPADPRWRNLRVLRAGTATVNVGQGAVELNAVNLADCDNSNDNVTQIIHRSDGTTRSVPLPVGAIIYHPGHGHFHLRDWAVFRLVRKLPSCADPSARASDCVVARGDKRSFCVVDSRLFDAGLPAGPRTFNDCVAGDDETDVTMGISRGWVDVYNVNTPENFIELGTLAGDYWLEAEANAGSLVQERTRNNNIGRTEVVGLTGNECQFVGGTFSCAPGVGNCTSLDCRGINEACCTCPTPGPIECLRCKEYFCYLDPNSPACLGHYGTCPPPPICDAHLPVPLAGCATWTPTATAPTRTPTRTPTVTPTGSTPTPTYTPPTPVLAGLALLMNNVSGNPGAPVNIPIHLTGGLGLVGGLQLDLLLPSNAVNAPNPATACTLDPRLTSSHVLHAALPADHPVAGKHRLRVLVADKNVETAGAGPIDAFTDGVVAACSVTIRTDAVPGTYRVDVSLPRAGDVRGTELWPSGGLSFVTVNGGCPSGCCSGCC